MDREGTAMTKRSKQRETNRGKSSEFSAAIGQQSEPANARVHIL